MALYQDGRLISGANTLPQMTLAEYNALPADQRPTYWERLDADYDDILAPKTDIATVESGTTASRAYSAGELLYYNGTLHKAKVPIASGATFTEGTNIEPTNVNNAIKEVDKGSVSVTANGTKTRATLLNELAALIDFSKITTKSYFTVATDSSIYYYYMDYRSPNTDEVRFTFSNSSASSFSVLSARIIKNGSSKYTGGAIGSGTFNITDQSAGLESNGIVYTLYY